MSTGISYLDETWSPVTGCSGKGCKAHCWAKAMVKRFPVLHDGDVLGCNVDFSQPVFHPSRLDKPLHWRKPRRVGVCFCGDLFDEQVPFEWVSQVLNVASPIDIERHQFFFLTKQAQRMRELICLWAKEESHGCYDWKQEIPLNFWFGVSITDQDDADRMIPELLKVPGKKWISVEPMLGPVNLANYLPVETIGGVEFESWPSWVVLGCESGPKGRRRPHEWMIDVVKQCDAAGVRVYVKQVDMGKRVSHDPEEWPEELRRREIP